ncbi:hypothetical protein OKJ48_39735 [Streptomyces kunmingensis]|uniref:Uncharacterized protein n=1 Tax=Streptomyces kunmingensis TaxID=68225 RepID=A0ABU6CQW2_9ACTN|nr:hypothetical protein [Streptomyces kunmingensis]MEB3966316.1 hypothetical protein [Streptomyces kunmingensis]
MRLGKALATGIAEEAPREAGKSEAGPQDQELTIGATVDELPEPVEVPAAR